MEPMPPNDPLWDLLRKAKPAMPRANFVRNVVREARQTAQDHGLFAKIKGWWLDNSSPSPGFAWAAAAAVVLLTATFVSWEGQPAKVAAETPAGISQEALLTEIDFPIVPEFESEWKTLEQQGSLVAVQDTNQLTASEIHLLLY